MSHETVLLVMIALAIVLLSLGVWGWRRRTRRDAGIAAPIGEIPHGATVHRTFSGFYVATTVHDQPLERLAIGGLGFRSRVEMAVTDQGLALDLPGQPRLFLPVSLIIGVGQATVAIDRVVEKDGLVRLTWRAADRVVDTFLRPQDASARSLSDAVAGILPQPSASDTTTPTGIDA